MRPGMYGPPAYSRLLAFAVAALGGAPQVSVCVALTGYTIAATTEYAFWWVPPGAAGLLRAAGVGIGRFSPGWPAVLVANVAIVCAGWFAGLAVRERRKRITAAAESRSCATRTPSTPRSLPPPGWPTRPRWPTRSAAPAQAVDPAVAGRGAVGGRGGGGSERGHGGAGRPRVRRGVGPRHGGQGRVARRQGGRAAGGLPRGRLRRRDGARAAGLRAGGRPVRGAGARRR